MKHHHSTRSMDWAQTLLFSGVLVSLGIAFTVAPKEEISEGEKRKLAQIPDFSWAALGDGSYMKKIDDYVADNFVMRYALTDWAGRIKQWRGLVQDDIQVFSDKGGHPGGGPAKQPVTPASPQPDQASANDLHASPAKGHPNVESSPPTRSASSQSARPDVGNDPAATSIQADDAPYQNIESIIIYKGRAVQMLGGTPKMAAPFASVLMRYQQELPEVTLYFMGIPIGADFYLPHKINKGVMKERQVIEHMHTIMPPQVRPVHAYDKLAQHTSEYVYFNTDHHWTGLGAYYAYTAFAEAAQLNPLPLSALVKKEIPHFLGTLYHRTLAPALKAKGDTVEYYKIPVQTSVKYYPAGNRQGLPTQLYAEYARGAGAYGVFLGGDYPMLKISSDLKNGRKIILVKDSYGNAFAPYLASHYEEVYVLDYRYFNGNIKTLIKEQGIQELLFAHNTYVFLGGYAAQRARGFLTGTIPVARPPASTESAP